nr:replication initiation factor domain-containing protein [uncultured Albidiferax sp.]
MKLASKKSALVLDGNEIKHRLEAERTRTKSPVHIDWVRFTVQRRNAPTPPVDVLFPGKTKATGQEFDAAWFRFQRLLEEVTGEEQQAAMQAHELAVLVAAALGSDFQVQDQIKKGQDFYKNRWSIVRHDFECGWVGFGASSDSPRQQSQAKTIHANIFGMACTFAAPGWNHRLADLAEAHDADITRVDLALDFFDGLPGGMQGVRNDYLAGLCNSNGKKLKHNMIGPWADETGRGRSFYIGSKEAGKQTNAYEKGDQLFGPEALSNWLRIELRYGNKLRVLPVEMLRHPADFFAGASEWHAAKLLQADHIAEPQPVKTNPRLPLETVDAEVSRVWRWLKNTPAAAICIAFEFMGENFAELLENQVRPGRLQKFGKAEISAAFARLNNSLSPAYSTGPAANFAV